MKIEIFTDGACLQNGKTGAIASYAFWLPEHPNLSKAAIVPPDQNQTNNRGELLAILEGVKCVSSNFPPADVDLQLYTDSMYSKNCLTIWIPGWIQRGWKTTDNRDVANRDLIEESSTYLSKFKSYTITHVRAHTGKDDYLSKQNAIVDTMAVEILKPSSETKIITTNKSQLIEGCPLQLMGPPVSEQSLIKWCCENTDKLDRNAFETALITALSKTAKKNGYSLEKQKLHRSSLYRLVASNLIAEKPTIEKEE